jgi:hypothetical protein
MKEADKIIDALGGTKIVSELCNLHISSVSQWRIRGIPPGWKRYLETLPLPSKRIVRLTDKRRNGNDR